MQALLGSASAYAGGARFGRGAGEQTAQRDHHSQKQQEPAHPGTQPTPPRRSRARRRARPVISPVEGPLHRLLPLRVRRVAVLVAHVGLPALVLGPALAQLVEIRPEADGQAGREGGAERRRLGHGGADHRHAEHVGLELHEQLVGGHAAVDAQLGEGHAGDGVGGVDHLAGLPGRGLERRARDVARAGVGGQADDHAARVVAPVRGEQAGEGGHEVDAAVVVHGARQLLDLGRRSR